MPATPNWQAATGAFPGQAGHVNQLLTTHTSTVIYEGTQRAAQLTPTGGSPSFTATDTVSIAQQFTTAVGQTTIGWVGVQIAPTHNSGASGLNPTTVSIFANSAGAPTGAALISTTLTAEYAFLAPTVLPIPLPVTGLTASTTYWVVVAQSTDATHNYHWTRSNQVSGASTSPNGTTWTAQAYGMVFSVNDGVPAGLQLHTWEDGGARWTWTGHNGSGLATSFAEYTVGQNTPGYLQSVRTLNYSANTLLSVS